MKTTGVSTSSLCNGIDIFTKNLNRDVIQLRKEAVTGQRADYGLHLGGKIVDVLEFNQEKQHLTETLDSNNLAKTRLEISQGSLATIDNIYQDMLEKTMILHGNDEYTALDQISNMAKDSLISLTNSANTMNGGEYLFSGINTLEKPFKDYFAKDSAAKKSFDQMLENFLKENSQNLPKGQNLTVSSMNSSQMTEFIEKLENAFFNDDYWLQNWSNASHQNIKHYIGNTEERDISVNVNMGGVRNCALFSVIGTELLSKELAPESRDVLHKKLSSVLGKGLMDLNYNSSLLGIVEKRIDQENVLIEDKKSIIEKHVANSIGIDLSNTSIVLEELVNKINISYMITSKLQKLSLLNYI
ncbi:MAG: flagellar hook-associated family protein [Candidatus Liberibacter ctenarytainae]|uniref:Flagellin n=1 Tax=Candidatus Liberibacter ctenarytainae TaxID=2020335 RepID=A0A937DKR5_9HYPH|nr:flagellar hook-associated family protein [Candidatus Liberibacter ctenarytainae]